MALSRRAYSEAVALAVEGMDAMMDAKGWTRVLGAQVASSSSDSSDDLLLITDHLTGRRVSLALFTDGKLRSPSHLRAQIMRPLELIQAEACFFAQRSPRCKHRRKQSLPPLPSIFVEHPPSVRVLLKLPCVAAVLQRLVTAPAHMHVTYSLRMWSWAEAVMERVTRGRVKKVQVTVRLQRACCAVLCAALVVPLLAHPICFTPAAANTGFI